MRLRRKRARRLLAALLVAANVVLLWQALGLVLPGCALWNVDPSLAAPDGHLLAPPPGTPTGERRVLAVRSLGHCCVIIEQAGRTLVTDPMLAPRMAGTLARSGRAPGLEALPRKIDAILITHFHYDHFSRWTLDQMDRGATLVGPRRMAERYGGQFRRTVELEPWQSAEVGLWKITAVPAWHATGRSRSAPYDPATTTGYVIEGPGPTVYVSGDSGYREHFLEIGRRFRIDLALVNVNNHLPGADAAQAVRDVGAAVWAPLHWGGYPMFDNPLIGRQLQALRREQLPQGRMVWLIPGGEAARFMRPGANPPAAAPPK